MATSANSFESHHFSSSDTLLTSSNVTSPSEIHNENSILHRSNSVILYHRGIILERHDNYSEFIYEFFLLTSQRLIKCDHNENAACVVRVLNNRRIPNSFSTSLLLYSSVCASHQTEIYSYVDFCRLMKV